MTIYLTFDALDGVSLFFPGVELRFSYDCAVSEKGVSSGWIIKGEYCMGNSLFS